MDFNEELDARLRRLCEVTDDTRQVEVGQELEWSGHCSECDPSASMVTTVTVYDNAPGEKVRQVLGNRWFYNAEELFEELKKVEINA